MGKLRFLLALWLAKLSVPALKITRHNGTDFPGSLALKLCPDFLRYVGKPGTIIAVTGTNGKTTVSNLLTDILEEGTLLLFCGEDSREIVSAAFQCQADENSVYLPGVVSRKKQMVPSIMSSIQNETN